MGSSYTLAKFQARGWETDRGSLDFTVVFQRAEGAPNWRGLTGPWLLGKGLRRLHNRADTLQKRSKYSGQRRMVGIPGDRAAYAKAVVSFCVMKARRRCECVRERYGLSFPTLLGSCQGIWNLSSGQGHRPGGHLFTGAPFQLLCLPVS